MFQRSQILFIVLKNFNFEIFYYLIEFATIDLFVGEFFESIIAILMK